MLNTLLIVVHVFVALVLILVVLLQSGKGAGLGAGFGGSSQSVFGARGPQSFLGKFTTGAAIVFMLTSLTLSMLSAGTSHHTVVDSIPAAPKTGKADTPAPVVPAPATSGNIDPFKAVKEMQAKETTAPAPAKDAATPQSPAGETKGK